MVPPRCFTALSVLLLDGGAWGCEMIDLRPGRWQDTLAGVECDAPIVDAPYGERTHSGHDAASGTHDYHRSGPGLSGSGRPVNRAAITYTGWAAADVDTFVADWSPRTRGRMVSITSHDLAPVWAAAMEASGRYVFAPLPWVAPGSRVRLAGDGPSSWTCWIVVGRPRTGADRNGRAYAKWGTLPGAYVMTSDRGGHIGGKPLSLMEALVRDYSRPGDVVCDPCAGYGTTLAAAVRQGRRAVGSEMDPDTHAQALAWLDTHARQTDLLVGVPDLTQESLL